MKDPRFIELVNLYIDRQITPEESAELEAEIQANPQRRKVYLQYCRMHHATKLVYQSFRAQSGQPQGAIPQPGSIARFERRERGRWLYAAGGLAAAACVAFIFMRNPTQTAPAAAESVQAVAPQVAAVAVTPPAAPASQASFSVLTREEPDYAAMLATLRQAEQRSFASSPSIQGASLFDDGNFDSKRLLPLNSRRNTAPSRKTDGRTAAEFTAFQFQR